MGQSLPSWRGISDRQREPTLLQLPGIPQYQWLPRARRHGHERPRAPGDPRALETGAETKGAGGQNQALHYAGDAKPAFKPNLCSHHAQRTIPTRRPAVANSTRPAQPHTDPREGPAFLLLRRKNHKEKTVR